MKVFQSVALIMLGVSFIITAGFVGVAIAIPALVKSYGLMSAAAGPTTHRRTHNIFDNI